MALPNGDLADYFEGMFGTVRHGGVTGEFFVGEVGVVLDGAHGFYQVDSLACFAQSEFGAPYGGIQRGREVNVLCLISLAVVGVVTGFDEVAYLQVGPGTVEIGLAKRAVHWHICFVVFHNG